MQIPLSFLSEPKFKVILSDDFFPEHIVNKHIRMIEKTGIRTMNDLKLLIHKSIESITLPSISHKALIQSHVYEPRIPYQNGLPSFDLISQEVEIAFRIYEGFVNWFYMFDLINDKHRSTNDDRYFDYIHIDIYDNSYKNLFYKITYQKLVFDGQLGIGSISYENRIPTVKKSFNIKFRFYTVTIKNRFDDIVYEWTNQ